MPRQRGAALFLLPFPLLLGITAWSLSGFIICCEMDTHGREDGAHTPAEFGFAGRESVQCAGGRWGGVIMKEGRGP